MLRLAREAKARALKKKLEAIAAAKKKRADAIKAAKRAKAEKMRRILAKAEAAANALKAKKLKLHNKTVKQVSDVCFETMLKGTKKAFDKHYKKDLIKWKNKEKAATKAGLEAIDHCKFMKPSL